jgi:predicted dehydrogenase
MSKIKVGVVGIGRGRSMINYCRISDNAELVAVCDIWEPGLEKN